MSKKLLLALVVVLVGAGMVSAGGAKEPPAGAPTLVIATDSTWPPMEFVDENKEIVGFDIDLMRAIGGEAGFKVEFKSVAWDGIFAGLMGGKYDAVISSVTITPERAAQMDFSEPYINAGQILVVSKDLRGVKDLAGMSGKIVGAQIGTTGSFEIEKVDGVTLKTYSEIGLAIEDLYNGRIDGVVCDTPVAADYALQNEKYKATLKILGEPFTDEYYGIVVQKGNAEILEKINAGLAAVQKKGLDKRFEKKWLR